MSLVDSIDSILMLYSYTGFPDRSWTLFERSRNSDASNLVIEKSVAEAPRDMAPKPEHIQSLNAVESLQQPQSPTNMSESSSGPEQLPTTTPNTTPLDTNIDNHVATDRRVKMNVMSGLSIILTLMSILVAFR